MQIATPFYSSRVSFRLKSRNGRYAAYTNIIGIYPEAFDALGYKLSDGTSFADSKKDYSMVRRQCGVFLPGYQEKTQ